jgi:hypothetical protein
MYVIAREKKFDPALQWSLPDRVFFACGACQVLAFVAMRSYRGVGFQSYWLRPAEGYRGNHVIVSDGEWAFDYHGWSRVRRLLDHTARKAGRWWPGWSCTMIRVEAEVLVSEPRSKAMGLHLREPGQFLFDALPRASAFLALRPPPPAIEAKLSGIAHISG